VVRRYHSRSASEVANILDYYGSYTNFSVDKDNATAGILVLKKYANEVLPVFHELLTQPAFKESELEIFRNKHKQIFEIEQVKVKTLPGSSFRKCCLVTTTLMVIWLKRMILIT
ncbi:MAG: hypothetical protein HC830_12395, partial [Bacteroidetes bacterium]|nr:hypothetical protein [Bacteroidota bacterium]